MRIFLVVLTAIQLIGIVAAAIAAAIEIETIVATGPTLALVGLLISSFCYYWNLQLGFCFGLSTPTIAVVCFTSILGFSLSPQEASLPIGALIVIFSLADAPVGVVAIREIQRSQFCKRNAKFQFRIATLMGLMFLTAIFFGLFRIGGEAGVAIGIIIVYTTIASYAVKCFYQRRAEKPLGNVSV
jgi:hypothetical protein